MAGPVSYDDPNTQVRHEANETITGASARVAFTSKQDRSLKAIHGYVVVAGTGTDLRLEVMNGTSSLGVLALSTSAIGTTTSLALSGTQLGTLGVLSVLNASDATGVVALSLEYEVDKDSTAT